MFGRSSITSLLYTQRFRLTLTAHTQRLVHTHEIPKSLRRSNEIKTVRKNMNERKAREFLNTLQGLLKKRVFNIETEFYQYREAYSKEMVNIELPAVYLKRLLYQDSQEERERFYENFLKNKQYSQMKNQNVDISENTLCAATFSENSYRKQLRNIAVRGYLHGNPIVIDLDYPQTFVRKSQFQLQKCYGINSKADEPFQIHLSGVGNMLHFQNELSEGGSLEHMLLYPHHHSFMEVFPKHKLVYLTENADPLKEFNPDDIYVIGGYTNTSRSLESSDKAKKYGIRSASLPLEKIVRLQTQNTNGVLSIDEVFSIMVIMNFCHDWKQAIVKSIPMHYFLPPDLVKKLKSMDYRERLENIERISRIESF